MTTNFDKPLFSALGGMTVGLQIATQLMAGQLKTLMTEDEYNEVSARVGDSLPYDEYIQREIDAAVNIGIRGATTLINRAEAQKQTSSERITGRPKFKCTVCGDPLNVGDHSNCERIKGGGLP